MTSETTRAGWKGAFHFDDLFAIYKASGRLYSCDWRQFSLLPATAAITNATDQTWIVDMDGRYQSLVVLLFRSLTTYSFYVNTGVAMGHFQKGQTHSIQLRRLLFCQCLYSLAISDFQFGVSKKNNIIDGAMTCDNLLIL